MKEIIVSGPVIIENGKLLVNKDDNDDFYKLPGGTVDEELEDLEEACYRETREEINADITIIKRLSPLILNKNPTTHDRMRIELHHYLAKLNNPDEIKPIPPIKEIKWLDIAGIKRGKYNVAPNIKYLIEQGEIK